MGKQRFLPYQHAKEYVQKFNIKSRAQYWRWHDETKPPLPKYPNRAWPDQWESWNVFLNTTNSFEPRQLGDYLPFYEAMRLVHKIAKEHDITSEAKWHEKYHEVIPKNIPKYPQTVYPEWNKIESKWPSWLGTNVQGKISSAKNIERLFAVCQAPHSPPNVILPAIGTKHELQQKLQQQEIGRVYKAYHFTPDDKETIDILLKQHGHKQDDGTYIVPNVNALLWSLSEFLQFYTS